MSNRIIAVDLGSWSVKVAIASPGLRHANLTAFVERPVPDGETPYEERAGAVLAQIVKEHRIDHDSVYLGVSGDQVFTHVLEFAFKTLRRADLDKAVGAELEGVVPVDLEDMVYTFEPLPPEPPRPVLPPVDPAAEAGPPRPPVGMRVLTYAMPRARAETALDVASRAGAPPRGLIPAAGPMARLVDRAPSLVAARGHGPLAVVDVGHARTDVVVVRGGKPVYARTIGRGGKQLTDAIARRWNLPTGEAEKAKHSDGYVASATMPPTSEQWARISEVTTAELTPLARELRQSLAACRAKTGSYPTGVVLVGGGSRLRGLDHFLGEQLGLPVVMLAASDVDAMVGARLAGTVAADGAALALGMIADASTGRPLFDLRQGPLAARVDLSFLRARAHRLAFAAVAIIACITASGWAAHYKLRKAQTVLTERVAVESAELFEVPQSPDTIINGSNTAGAGATTPMPKMTAWEILLEISNKLPAREKVTIDVESIEIDASRIVIRGVAKSVDEIDAIQAVFTPDTCFQDVVRGPVQQNNEQKWQFDLSMKNGCM